MATQNLDDHHFERHSTASTVGLRRESTQTRELDLHLEDELRERLANDPNDKQAFAALVELVLEHVACEQDGSVDPLSGGNINMERSNQKKMTQWALAEEFSGHPQAWSPLLVLARQSINEEPDEAFRRINAAIERDPSGLALTESIAILLNRGHEREAFNQARGHWQPRSHLPEAGVAVVRSALRSGQPEEAAHALAELLEVLEAHELSAIDDQLISDVKAAQTN